MFSSLRRFALLVAPALLLLALASSASAAVTSTNITSPATNSGFVWLSDTSTGSITVTGTAEADDGDEVDIRCYYGMNSSTLASGVNVSGGAFSVTASLGNVSDTICTLRAVPANATPSDKSPFAGPAVFVSYVSVDDRSNTDYYIGANQRRGAFGYDSAGWCGISWSSVISPELDNQYSSSFFYCNQYASTSNFDGSASPITVDGQNAYLPGAISPSFAGFVKPTFSYSFDAANNLTITEQNKLFTCPTETRSSGYVESCDGGLIDTGIRLDRTIRQDHEGLQSRITDNWVNTTGASRAFAIAYDQWFGDDIDASFPNGASVSNGTAGQTVAGKFPDASTIRLSVTGEADNDPSYARGAITMYPGADSVTFGRSDEFFTNYSSAIAPGATYTIDTVFNQAISSAEVNQLAADAAKLITPQPKATPQPSFGTPTAAKATYNKKTKRISLATGRSVVCPPGGQACAVTGKLTAKVKLPAKKAKKKSAKKSAKSKKKPKAKYKTYTIGKVSMTVAPGTTAPINLVLSKSSGKLLIKYKKLNINFPISVVAGSLTGSQLAKFTVKAPKIPKPKKKSTKKKK